ncbi:MAG TPA: DUF721 domain-containing protein, partial [Candidatus Polarisedimenticolia bacterium]|nr:DUF721 domain-containing protein [Candidatus Polarisedimenticolia bacterium]
VKSLRRPRVSETFQPVGSVLDQVIRSLRLESRFAAAEATDRWSSVVAPEVLARTRCVGVRDGELLVEVRGSVWMGHLAVLSQGLLEEMNRTLPLEKRISSIRLVPMRSKEEIER